MHLKWYAQIKKRRLELGFKQADMKLRIGMNQQQYQRVETGKSASFESMQRIAEGLQAEWVLVPKAKLAEVMRVLEGQAHSESDSSPIDPWADLMDEGN